MEDNVKIAKQLLLDQSCSDCKHHVSFVNPTSFYNLVKCKSVKRANNIFMGKERVINQKIGFEVDERGTCKYWNRYKDASEIPSPRYFLRKLWQ